jgi:metal-responsive CopG/Arc/MetJ family transcriptional regulator
MGRVGLYLEDELEHRLKEYAFKKMGSFRGQSEIIRLAIKEYLEKHENEVVEQGNPEGIPVLA